MSTGSETLNEMTYIIIYHKLIDIINSLVPMASHQYYNCKTLKEITLFKDLPEFEGKTGRFGCHITSEL